MCMGDASAAACSSWVPALTRAWADGGSARHGWGATSVHIDGCSGAVGCSGLVVAVGDAALRSHVAGSVVQCGMLVECGVLLGCGCGLSGLGGDSGSGMLGVAGQVLMGALADGGRAGHGWAGTSTCMGRCSVWVEAGCGGQALWVAALDGRGGRCISDNLLAPGCCAVPAPVNLGILVAITGLHLDDLGSLVLVGAHADLGQECGGQALGVDTLLRDLPASGSCALFFDALGGLGAVDAAGGSRALADVGAPLGDQLLGGAHGARCALADGGRAHDGEVGEVRVLLGWASHDRGGDAVRCILLGGVGPGTLAAVGRDGAHLDGGLGSAHGSLASLTRSWSTSRCQSCSVLRAPWPGVARLVMARLDPALFSGDGLLVSAQGSFALFLHQLGGGVPRGHGGLEQAHGSCCGVRRLGDLVQDGVVGLNAQLVEDHG
jgi:hypothetical protein